MLAGGLDLPEPSQPREGRPDARQARRGARVDAGWRAIGQLCRVVVPGSVVGVALLGALFEPRLSMAGALFLGVLATGVVALVHPDFPAQVSARRAVVLAAFWGVVAAPFGAGVVALGNGGAAVVLLILVLIPLWVAGQVLEDDQQWTEDDLARLRTALPDLPTPTLLDLWRDTDRAVHGTSASPERERAVELRALLLDELAERDPSGVDAWLRHPGSRPDAYIGGDRKG